MKKFFLYGSLFSLLFLSYGIVTGENISEKIQLNGFLSQGYVLSRHNDFIPQSSKYGSFEFNEFGLTVTADASKKLRLGFQLLARDFGPIGNHKIMLDWGFADYRASNALGVRIGKIKTPVGLYNEIRDTDTLYPMVVLPQSIYDETMRPVFIAYNGAGLHGNMDIGSGSLNYDVFAGGVNHPEEAPYLKQIQTAINTGIAPMGMQISPVAMDTQSFFGGRLTWKTPVKGLRLGGNFLNLRAKFNSILTMPGGAQTPIYGRMVIKKCFFLSAEWNIGNFTLSSEYMELPVYLYLDFPGNSLLLSDETMQGYYVMGSYVIGDKWTLYGIYDYFVADKGDNEGMSAVKLGYPAFVGWQEDIVCGVRFDVNFNWTIKLEYHFIDGLAKSYVFSDLSDIKRNWNLLTAKLSFNF